MKSTLNALTLALSIALPLGSAVAETTDTAAAATPSFEQRTGDYAGQARTRAAEFKASRDSQGKGYDVRNREQSREQVRTQAQEKWSSREQASGDFAANRAAARDRWASGERPTNMQRPSGSRPSMPVQRPRMR